MLAVAPRSIEGKMSRRGGTTTTACKNYSLTIQYSKIRDAGFLVLERSD